MIDVDVKKKIRSSGGDQQLHARFQIGPGELVTLFGESGSGKTTILRMIAGLTHPDQGRIVVNDEIWFDHSQRIDRPVQQRSIGMVFQDATLFPNMTLRQNLEYAVIDGEGRGLIQEYLALMRLDSLADQKPSTLSGGQKQRVALIRALLRRPSVFLLDEPLSAMDLKLRIQLQDELLQLHEKVNIPTLFVTHDLSEVVRMSRRVLMLADGQIKHDAAPDRFFQEHLCSGKFRFPARIVDIKPDEPLSVITLQIGQHLSRIVASKEEWQGLQPGDTILVATKAFNPIIVKPLSIKSEET